MVCLSMSVTLGFCHESTRINDDCLSDTYATEKMYPAIIIPPIASICENPNCVAINTLRNPITEAEPSFIEFLASVLKDRRLCLFAIFLICIALYSDITLAVAKTIIVKIG